MISSPKTNYSFLQGAPMTNPPISPATFSVSKGENSRKRRVKFSNDVCVRTFESAANMNEDIKSNVYSKATELQKLRRSAVKVARAVYEKDQDTTDINCYSFALWEAFDSCTQAVVSENDKIPEQVTENLQYWINKGASRRGLEKWSIPALAKARREIKGRAVQCVLRMQSRKIAGICLKEHPDVIARVYRQINEPAQMYAALMGEADEKAARTGEEKHPRREKKEKRRKKKEKSTSKPKLKKCKSAKLHASRECHLSQKEISPKRMTQSCRTLFVR